MKERKFKLVLAFVVATCLAAAVPVGAEVPPVNCQEVIASNDPGGPLARADSDGDGLSDWLECTQVMLRGGTAKASCVDPIATDPQAARKRCLMPKERLQTVDPETRDIFIVMIPSEPYVDPINNRIYTSFVYDFEAQQYKLDVLKFAGNYAESGGLGLTVHLLTPEQAYDDRTITDDPGCYTKAVRIWESLEPSTINGITPVGTPVDEGETIVYTRSIVDLVNGEYGGLDTPDVWVPYTMHTFSHELGHKLTEYEPPSRKDGNHLPGGTEWIMERFVVYKYSNKDGYTTFYTGKVFAPETQAGIEFYR